MHNLSASLNCAKANNERFLSIAPIRQTWVKETRDDPGWRWQQESEGKGREEENTVCLVSFPPSLP